LLPIIIVQRISELLRQLRIIGATVEAPEFASRIRRRTAENPVGRRPLWAHKGTLDGEGILCKASWPRLATMKIYL
jgi:hypothetical protein